MNKLAVAVLTLVASGTAAPAMAQYAFGLSGNSPFVGARPGDAVLTFDGITPFNATDSGWIKSTGQHSSTNSNYIVGRDGTDTYNNYFSFVVGAAAPASPYTSATLTIRNALNNGPFPFTYTLYDVSASPLDVDQDRSSGDATGQALYADLGSGTSFGSFTFTGAAAPGSFTTIVLNQAFLDQVNRGLLLNFAIGGTLTPAATPVVPEPASWALMMLGFGGLGHVMRRGKTVVRVRFA